MHSAVFRQLSGCIFVSFYSSETLEFITHYRYCITYCVLKLLHHSKEVTHCSNAVTCNLLFYNTETDPLGAMGVPVMTPQNYFSRVCFGANDLLPLTICNSIFSSKLFFAKNIDHTPKVKTIELLSESTNIG